MKSIILHDFEVRNALKNDVIQIRRPIPIKFLPGFNPEWSGYVPTFEYGRFFMAGSHSVPATKEIKCPFGQPGDRLWAKETWQAVSPDENYRIIEECNIIYAATDIHPGFLASEYRYHNGYKNDDGADVIYPWESSIHMPRWASRITLEVDDIRVELVQDINHEDAVQEGVIDWICNEYSKGTHLDNAMRGAACSKPKRAFALLWDSLYAKKGFEWDESLSVWVGKFKIVERK
jgi:hypothetical protein